MDSDDIIFGVFTTLAIIILIFCIGLLVMAIASDWDSDDDVYMNVLANVTGKDSDTITTVSVISTGKTTSVVPITTTTYELMTTKGNVSVSSEEYYSLNENDTVVLTKNLNTSSLNYNCKVEV